MLIVRTLLALLTLAGADSRSDTPVHGPFDVGVTSSVALDSARMEGGRPRPIQITTWYPTKKTSNPRVTYGYYVDLAAGEKTLATDSSVAAGRAAFFGFIQKAGVSQTDVAAWLATPMLAVANAERTAASFPLLIIVNGNGQSAVDESSMAEYMASYGYVVAASPSYTRISHPPASESEIGAGSEEQADDISFIIGELSKRNDVSPRQVGLIGHSLGARGALLFAMRNERVGALVSLDGGIGTATARAAMEAAPSFEPRRLSAALLHFYETADAFMVPDFTLFRDLRNADITVARVTGMHHHHFADLGAWVGRVSGLAKATGATAETAPSYRTMLDVSRAFLDARLKGNKAGFVDARDLSAVAAHDRPAVVYDRLDTISR